MRLILVSFAVVISTLTSDVTAASLEHIQNGMTNETSSDYAVPHVEAPRLTYEELQVALNEETRKYHEMKEMYDDCLKETEDKSREINNLQVAAAQRPVLESEENYEQLRDMYDSLWAEVQEKDEEIKTLKNKTEEQHDLIIRLQHSCTAVASPGHHSTMTEHVQEESDASLAHHMNRDVGGSDLGLEVLANDGSEEADPYADIYDADGSSIPSNDASGESETSVGDAGGNSVNLLDQMEEVETEAVPEDEKEENLETWRSHPEAPAEVDETDGAAYVEQEASNLASQDVEAGEEEPDTLLIQDEHGEVSDHLRGARYLQEFLKGIDEAFLERFSGADILRRLLSNLNLIKHMNKLDEIRQLKGIIAKLEAWTGTVSSCGEPNLEVKASGERNLEVKSNYENEEENNENDEENNENYEETAVNKLKWETNIDSKKNQKWKPNINQRVSNEIQDPEAEADQGDEEAGVTVAVHTKKLSEACLVKRDEFRACKAKAQKEKLKSNLEHLKEREDTLKEREQELEEDEMEK